MFTHTLTTYRDPRLGIQHRATVFLDGQWWMEWTGNLDYVTDHLAGSIRAPGDNTECSSTPAQHPPRKGTP